jgi:hypothetical protein
MMMKMNSDIRQAFLDTAARLAEEADVAILNGKYPEYYLTKAISEAFVAESKRYQEPVIEHDDTLEDFLTRPDDDNETFCPGFPHPGHTDKFARCPADRSDYAPAHALPEDWAGVSLGPQQEFGTEDTDKFGHIDHQKSSGLSLDGVPTSVPD